MLVFVLDTCQVLLIYELSSLNDKFTYLLTMFPFLQAGLTVRAVQKYLLGTDMSLFTTEHMDGGAPSQPYPSNSPGGGTTETTETYQSPPFTENNAAPTYQVPIY